MSGRPRRLLDEAWSPRPARATLPPVHEALLARAPLLVLALLSAGCATGVTVTTPLAATPLLGPYPSRDEACRTMVKSGAREGWQASTCSATPIEVGSGAPMSAAILMVRDGAVTDPRLTGSGAYFLGLSASSAWFLTTKALDEMNGAAGHTYLPSVTVEAVTLVPRRHADPRLLFRLRDTTVSVCNVCEGAEHDKRTPVDTHRLVMVCGRVGSSKPECTPPLTVSVGADVSLEEDTLTVSEPGKPRADYLIGF
jgi:hypothetical protein